MPADANSRDPKGHDQPCLAYLLNGDLYVSCQGKKARITADSEVTDFGVDPQGTNLVLRRYGFTFGNGAWEAKSVEVVPLSRQTPTRSLPGTYCSLIPSCGTVFLFEGQNKAHDLLSGSKLEFAPYTHFRCDARRNILIGETDAKDGVLRIGLPPERVIARRPPQGACPILYDVSPDGRYVAFYDCVRLCALEGVTGALPSCVEVQQVHYRISVSNAGEVILHTALDEACLYRDPWHVSKEPLPGYNGGDQCWAVALWRPGYPALRIIEPLAYSPQWLTPEAAEALIGYANHTRATNCHDR